MLPQSTRSRSPICKDDHKEAYRSIGSLGTTSGSPGVACDVRDVTRIAGTSNGLVLALDENGERPRTAFFVGGFLAEIRTPRPAANGLTATALLTDCKAGTTTAGLVILSRSILIDFVKM